MSKVIDVATLCEQLGYHSLWAYDHLSPFWKSNGRTLECWATLAAVAVHTRRVKLGSLVTNVAFRNPALLAKITSTLDVISGGRLIVGLGAGDHLSRNELISHGIKFAPLEDRVGRLREAIEVLRALWVQEEASYAGRYYNLKGARNLPKPRQKEGPPVWVGGKHPKILDIVATLADGWNHWDLRGCLLKDRSEYLSRKCRETGRTPEAIVKSWSGSFASKLLEAETGEAFQYKVLDELEEQANSATECFIVALGERAGVEHYEQFAEAVKRLR